MRHNQNARRVRGRGNGGGDHSGGGRHHNSNGNGGQQGGRRVNLRVQSFDSNGPDVRIRGTAYQINEKYVTLARDATSAGDHVLAESYLQHAEHYQRYINEMVEETNRNNKQPRTQQQQTQQQQTQQQQTQQQQQPSQTQKPQEEKQPQPKTDDNNSPTTPETDKLDDLDQGFLVGSRQGQPDKTATPEPSDDSKEKPQQSDGKHTR